MICEWYVAQRKSLGAPKKSVLSTQKRTQLGTPPSVCLHAPVVGFLMCAMSWVCVVCVRGTGIVLQGKMKRITSEMFKSALLADDSTIETGSFRELLNLAPSADEVRPRSLLVEFNRW